MNYDMEEALKTPSICFLFSVSEIEEKQKKQEICCWGIVQLKMGIVQVGETE